MARRVAGVALTLVLGTALLASGEGERPADVSPPGTLEADPAAPAIAAVPLAELTAAAQLQRKSEAVVRHSLSKRVTVDFQETPLNEALEFLRSLAGIPIRIDMNALQEEGIAEDEPVTFAAADVTAAQVLNRVLTPHGLTFVVCNEVLNITTQVKADEILVARTYNVRRLVEAIDAQFEADKAAGKTPATRGLPPGFDVPGAAGDDRPGFQPLIDLIHNCTRGPWQDIQGDGGTISSAGSKDALVIRHTRQLHDEIAPMLKALEAFLDGKLQHGAVALRSDLYPADADARIRQALARRLPTLDLNDVPLKDAIGHLREKSGLPLIIDGQALGEEGVSLNEPITLQTESLTLQANLNLLLEPHGLTTVIDDGFLMVTTMVKSDEMLHAVLYDVRDLTAVMTSQAIVELIENETGGPWQDIQGDGGTIAELLNGALILRQTDKVHAEAALILHDLRESLGPEGLQPLEAGKPSAPPEDLAKIELRFYPLDRKGLAAEMQKTLVDFIEPESWTAHGGEGSIQQIGETLAVKNTLKVHKAIRKFLTDLKAAEDAPPEK